MLGLQTGLTRKDTQHFPILTMNENLSMLYIYIYIYPRSTQALNAECQDFSLD